MSLQSDVMYAVKQVLETLQVRYKQNLTEAMRKEMIELENSKVEGLSLLLNQTIEQVISNDSAILSNVLERHNG
tara:strand:- start:1567 stop:1788 length:222 start_codon:yes stop_codon:yes gene_type:complete